MDGNKTQNRSILEQDGQVGSVSSALPPAPIAETHVLDDTLTHHELRSLLQSPALELLITEFARHLVNRLFAAGLDLESARSMVGDSEAGRRIEAAVDQLDQMIRDIRTTVFSFPSV
jgi:hypothetical protein